LASNSQLTYELQVAATRSAVWIHASDGSTVGRFGRMGVDLHNTVTEMMLGASECRLCTHGKPSQAEWLLFRQKAFEWWGVHVPQDAFDPQLLKDAEERVKF
jgi:hypothetical protein